MPKRKRGTTSSSLADCSQGQDMKAPKQPPKSAAARAGGRKTASSSSSSSMSSSARKRTSKAEPTTPPKDATEGRQLVSNLCTPDDLVSCLRRARRVLVLAGAGISVAAGIPDFRSPGSGLYNSERFLKDGIPSPELFFDIEYFEVDPLPFYRLASSFVEKPIYPTKTHWFFRLLEQRRKLGRIYTQNIDGLELAAGIRTNKVVHCHGSFETFRCLKCRKKTTLSDCVDEFSAGLSSSEGVNIPYCSKCRTGVLKPEVTFFGEACPAAAFRGIPADCAHCDLLLVIGTSLQARSVAKEVFARIPNSTPRVLINKEVVSFNDHVAAPKGSGAKAAAARKTNKSADESNGAHRDGKKKRKRKDATVESQTDDTSSNDNAALASGFDFVLRGTSDAAVQFIADALGWREDLARLVASPPAEAAEIESPFNRIVYSTRRKLGVLKSESEPLRGPENDDGAASVCTDDATVSTLVAESAAHVDTITATYRAVRCGDRLFELHEMSSSEIAEEEEALQAAVTAAAAAAAAAVVPKAKRGRKKKVISAVAEVLLSPPADPTQVLSIKDEEGNGHGTLHAVLSDPSIATMCNDDDDEYIPHPLGEPMNSIDNIKTESQSPPDSALISGH